jgi:hypothetical protein
MNFVVGVICKTLSSKCELRQNRPSNNHISRRQLIYTLLAEGEPPRRNAVDKYEFREYRCSETHASLKKGANKNLPIFSKIFVVTSIKFGV